MILRLEVEEVTLASFVDLHLNGKVHVRLHNW